MNDIFKVIANDPSEQHLADLLAAFLNAHRDEISDYVRKEFLKLDMENGDVGLTNLVV